jgi:hypothetical protein
MFENSRGAHLQNMDAARRYMRSANTVAFVTTKDDGFIGGTCVRKDPTRLGMVLGAAAIPAEHRLQYAYSLVKSSLPFFRTVAIRDVDALVAEDDTNSCRFPFTIELESWTQGFLEKAGFSQIGEMLHVGLDLSIDSIGLRIPDWDESPRFEEAKELVWDVGRKTGLASSLTWTALEFGYESGTLYTYSAGKDVALLMSAYNLQSGLLINPIVYSNEVSPNQVAEVIRAFAAEHGKTRVDLAMLGAGQQGLVESLRDFPGNSISTRRLKLMRKML